MTVWYQDAERTLTAIAAAVQHQRTFSLAPVERLAGELISSLQHNDELVVEALSNPAGSALITNLIHVGILGAKVGIGLGYYGSELARLTLAGLTHDIGLFAVPKSLTTKSGRLTVEERTLIEQHPELGYQVMQGCGPAYDWLALLIRQAHERFNGLGYPSRLKGRQISEMALILGLVDIFDALVSERPYRRRLLPHEAIKELLVVERTAFPREILKALVEQLSVYPLGTTVRLTTGEVGIVTTVNQRYPLRPVVTIGEHTSKQQGSARQVNLSLLPLVMVAETLDPPAIGTIRFSEGERTLESKASPAASSDQFTALLESLDAIASAIEGVVESRTLASVQSDQSVTSHSMGSTVEPLGLEKDGVFRNEVIGLFALEAREWLAQIQTAIEKLATTPTGPVRTKLHGVILNGVTNLSRSASSVQLAEIEAMASELVPILSTMGTGDAAPPLETFRPFRQSFDRIVLAVRRLSNDRDAGGEQGQEPMLRMDRQASPHQQDTAPLIRLPPSVPLLKALRDLHQARTRSMQPARDVLEIVLDQAEHRVGKKADHIAAETLKHILKDLDRQDEEFVKDVREYVPGMTQALVRWKQANARILSSSQLNPLLITIDKLLRSSTTLRATTMTLFLQGLRSFLIISTQRTVDMLPKSLQAVEARLRMLPLMAEQWVTLGRLERAAIEQILPEL